MTLSPNLRWFRFSLRTLFVVVTLFGAGWATIEVRRAWLQHSALLEIQRCGHVSFVGRFSREYLGPSTPADSGYRALLLEFGRDIEDVFLEGPSISSESLNAVAHLRNPHSFYIGDGVITQDMVNVLHLAPTISEVGMERCSISDAIMRELTRAGHLTRLTMVYQSLSDAQADALSQMKQVQKLFLGMCSISDVGLERLVSMKDLKSLDLEFMSLSMPALTLLEGLDGLRSLKLNGVKLPEDSFLHLGKLKDLQELELNHIPISEAGLRDLSPALQKLRLITPMTAQGLGCITALRGVDTLAILCDTLSEDDLSILKSMPRLRQLHLVDPQSLSDDAIERLKRSLPNCKVTFTR